LSAHAELVTAVRECGEKCRTLHEASLEAMDALRQASDWNEFLVRACRTANEEEDSARHALKSAIEREAWEAVR
jgi:hypothetical protein